MKTKYTVALTLVTGIAIGRCGSGASCPVQATRLLRRRNRRHKPQRVHQRVRAKGPGDNKSARRAPPRRGAECDRVRRRATRQARCHSTVGKPRKNQGLAQLTEIQTSPRNRRQILTRQRFPDGRPFRPRRRHDVVDLELAKCFEDCFAPVEIVLHRRLFL